MNCKPGDLAVVVKIFNNPNERKYIGCLLRCKSLKRPGEWLYEPVSPILPTDKTIADEVLRPIRDQPGNESFVTEARKKAPWARKTEITERGELRV